MDLRCKVFEATNKLRVPREDWQPTTSYELGNADIEGKRFVNIMCQKYINNNYKKFVNSIMPEDTMDNNINDVQ